MSKTTRNLIIFTAVSLGGGFVGIAVDRLNPPANPMQGLGALIWLASPLVTGLLLRAFGGDGWQDAGFKLNLKTGWRWYLAALLIIPLVTLLVIVLGATFRAIDLSGFAAQGLGAFLSLAAATFGGSMVKNLFEEFAWRGYLTPRFNALKLHPLLNATLTGFIWAGWHIPYYLYFLDKEVLTSHTPLSIPVFILSAFLVLPFHALAYGELRLLSGSVWPAWLLHNVANAISLSLVSGGFMILKRNFAGVLLSPGTEGILSSLLMGLIGLILYRYRLQHQAPLLQKR
ncbi:MAG: CPBP family intramembrane metalloprotease [Ardenticatenaceae bacterium]|nr:CPBP family intramembrane metalloprotease [Anaerolineales bacterium]MCB8921793.1 CPBP family intramembrane metalloprotease [Ardenticatenaceae bacterium]